MSPQRPFLCVGLMLAFCAASPADPAWWSDSATAIKVPAEPAHDYSPANLGQLKHVAKQARKHINTRFLLAGGSGPAVNATTSGFINSKNFSPANIGQLKNVAKPFYDRIAQLGFNWQTGAAGTPTQLYPWTSTTHPDNAAPINLGQLKYIFSFDLSNFTRASTDSDGDGLDDLWEITYYGNLSQDGTGDLDGDGIPDYWELATGSDPAMADSDDDGIPDTWLPLPGAIHQPTTQEPWWIEEAVTTYCFFPAAQWLIYDSTEVKYYPDTVMIHKGGAGVAVPDRLYRHYNEPVIFSPFYLTKKDERNELHGSFIFLSGGGGPYFSAFDAHRSCADLYGAHSEFSGRKWSPALIPVECGTWPSQADMNNLAYDRAAWFSFVNGATIAEDASSVPGFSHEWRARTGAPDFFIKHISTKKSYQIRAKAGAVQHDVKLSFLKGTLQAVETIEGTNGTPQYPANGARFVPNGAVHLELFKTQARGPVLDLFVSIGGSDSYDNYATAVPSNTATRSRKIAKNIVLLPLPVEITLRATGNIEPSPENDSYQASKDSAGGTDVLGALPMGTGRVDYPGQAYTAPIQVIGKVLNVPNINWRWKRFITRRSWTIKMNIQGTGWIVTQRTKRGAPPPPDDDTGSSDFNDDTPSPADKIYIYDCSALLPAIGATTSVGDFVYEEKQFTYQIETNAEGGWTKAAELDVGQTIIAKRTATGNTAAAFQGIENSNQVRKLDTIITETEVRNMVGGTLPITIDANANN